MSSTTSSPPDDPQEDHFSGLPFELLIEINNHLPLADCHSLQNTNKLNATISRAYLDRIFMYDDHLRHRIPQYRWPFVPGDHEFQERDSEGHYEQATTLQYAVYCGDKVAVRRLINAGWDVNKTLRDEEGGCCRTPLGLAAGLGHELILRMLMRAGAEIEWGMPHGYNTMLDIKNREVQTWITEELAMQRRLRKEK
jgi:hypothetical protein